jgi:hypothetical protein
VAIALAVLGVSIFLAAFFLVLDRIRDEDNDPNVAIVATSTATVALPDPAQATGNATPQGTSPAPASSTMPPNPTSELVPSSPSPAPTATVAESEPTVTPVPEEPTATPEIPIDEPTQGEEPFAGDFGDLPPAILPSGGVSQSLTLNYELGMSLTALPASSWVYLLEWPLYSLDEVAAIAQQLGLFADVVEQGVGVYRVSADSGTLFVSPAEIVFAGAGFDTSGELLDDASALEVAAAWLATSSFAGANADGGSVVSRDDELGRIVVVFRPVEPAPNLAPTPSATLTIGPGGAVLEARIHWPSNLIASEYGLRAPNELWQLMIGGYGVLDADISGLSATGPLTGTANITDYTIAYTLAGSPANQQYLVPLLVFLGSATIDQTGEVIPVEIAVPSVYHQAGPLG